MKTKLKSIESENLPARGSNRDIYELLQLAGFRYWTGSLLPAFVGTTLPCWLSPNGFNFKWLGAIEFVLATILFHAGFSFVLAGIRNKNQHHSQTQLVSFAVVCLMVACGLGLLIHSDLNLNEPVYKIIFLIYGISSLFVGLLYVSPPFSFHRRVGGEIVLAEGLGMLPVLGAYLVQAGDLTRSVYIASLPVVAATGLWVWVEELSTYEKDKKTERRTLVMEFGLNFSARFGLLAIIAALFGSLFLAVISTSMSPLALIIFLFGGLVWKILYVSWKNYAYPEQMRETLRLSFLLHLGVCSLIIGSSLASAFF